MKTSSIILIASFVIGILIISILVIQNPPKNSVGVSIFDPNQKSHLQQYWEDAAKNSQNTIIIREQREIEMRPIITSGEMIDIEKLRDPKIKISGLKSEYAKDEPIHFEVLVIGDGSGCGGIGISIFREFKVQSPIFSQNYISICDGSGKFVATPISVSINSKDSQILHLGPGKYVVDASYYQDRGSFGQREQSFQITKLHVLEETLDVVPRPDLISQKHLTVEGLNETYGAGQKIEFTVKFNEIWYNCGIPQIRIEDSNHQNVWESDGIVSSCDPDMKKDHIEKEWKIGGTSLGTPIMPKEGFYTLFVTFSDDIIQKNFWVKSHSDVEIIGLEDTYKVGDNVRFYVTVQGFGMIPCDDFTVSIKNDHGQTVLDIPAYNTSCQIPVEPENYEFYFPQKNDSYKLSVNQTGKYTVSANFGANSLEKEFVVKEK